MNQEIAQREERRAERYRMGQTTCVTKDDWANGMSATEIGQYSEQKRGVSACAQDYAIFLYTLLQHISG